MIGPLEEIFAAHGHPIRCRDCPEMLHSADAAAQHFADVHGWRWMTGFLRGPSTSSPSALCPDLLRYEQIGEADGLRGRVVRVFFWFLRVWPPVEASRPRACSEWLDG